MGDKISFVQVDATKDESKSLAEEYAVRGYPTLFFWNGGDKSTSNKLDYDGPRDVEGMTQWLEAKLLLPQNRKYSSVMKQVVSQESFDKDCKNNRACVIAFLPELLDVDGKGRRKMMEMLSKMSAKIGPLGVRVLWAAAGDHPALEKAVDAGGSGYPSLFAFNGTKMV